VKIKGWATEAGTSRYHKKFLLPPWAVRKVFDLNLVGIGLGTYLGEADVETDVIQQKAILALLGSGCNVIDCAPNYRNGRAERTLGDSLRLALDDGVAKRDEIFISTKAGLVPENFNLPKQFSLGPDHSCYSPDYLLMSLEASLERLRLETVDCIFIHNLELLRLSAGESFIDRYQEVAAAMERMVLMNLARSWGISSFNGFRVKEDHPEYLSFDSLFSSTFPNLRYLQIPLGVWGPEAITESWQNGENILSRARNIGVFTNSPLLQGELAVLFGERKDLIESAVCFARDTVGVDVTLLGIKKMEHVESWKQTIHREPHDITELFLNFSV
jgi:aryl-alcohol dehydrogenase-like predicted oxidoreductase